MGTEERFRRIVDTHQERTYRVAYRILANREEALDVTQEAFLALHQNVARVREPSIGTWLVRVATNRSLDQLRRNGRMRTQSLPEELSPQRPPEDGPAEALARAEEHQCVMGALAQVSGRQREVLTLRAMEDMKFTEIGLALGISEGAAKVHFRRGLAALSALLGPRQQELLRP